MATYGKGKEYSRVEKVESIYCSTIYRANFAVQFKEFSRHIVPAWFLSNMKMELIKASPRRDKTLFVTSDFAENIVLVRKHELAEQYYHRVEILLLGAVISFTQDGLPGAREELKGAVHNEEDYEAQMPDLQLHQSSYLVSSDYRSVLYR